MFHRLPIALAFLSITLLAGPLAADDTKEAATKADQVPDFESYSLVILRRGPRAGEIPQDRLQEIQKQHMAHLTAMGESGKMVIAGPFSNQEDDSFRGLCLYRADIEEARKLANGDPAVKAGRLRVEVMTWWVERGYMTFPKAPPISDDPGS